MSDKNVGKIPLIIAVVLIAAGIFGYIAYQSGSDKKSLNETSAEDVLAELPQPEILDNAVEEVEDVVAEIAEFNKEALLNDGTSLPVRAIGDPNAPIYLVEYSSLTCGHCASFHTNTLGALKEKFVDTGKVYLIFREFPLNKPAVDASLLLRCMPEDKYYSFMNFLFDTQSEWAFTGDYLAKLKMNAKLAGLSDVEIELCLADKDMEMALAEGLKIGSEKYNVQSTPSFVINGGDRLITGNQPVSFFEKVLNGYLPVEEDVSEE